MQIDSTVALVTGASRGIGRSLVASLIARGARRVYAAARDPGSLAAIDRERIVPLALDVTDPAQVAAAAERAADANLVINNAGILSSFSVLASPLADLERDMATNYFGTLAVSRATVPALERTRGTLVNLLTIVSFAPMPALGGYSASKAAAFSLTQSLRGELRPRGIRVVGVYPGPVDTDMARGFDMAKASPDAVAQAIIEGLERGDEDILPDAFARDVYAEWTQAPKGVERRFAG